MSDNITSENEQLKQLIDSFVAYRNVLVPLQESLHHISDTYDSIKSDLDSLTKNLAGGGGLDKIHSAINAQAKSGQELSRSIESYASSGEKYAEAVASMTARFDEVAKRIDIVRDIEKAADGMLAKLEEIIAEKRSTYNLKELQKSLDAYNKNVEKISDFINKDIGEVLQANADKIEAIRKENEELAAVVAEQGKSVAELTATFGETSALLKKTVESGSVNEEYLFDAFDKWAADRKVKIKKK